MALVLVVCFCASCLATSFSYTLGAPVWLTVPLAVTAAPPFVALCLQKEGHDAPVGTFRCPLVPLVPCLGIAVNLLLCASLDKWAWLRLAAWLVVGLVLYFSYGIMQQHESTLT
eukprot:TRINITY_DN558_c0_g1_i1.p4 TRINITY_DN558_c0_g1~~TRINITY_DN558_c0_g1_i1.p4  ORF type:complete len:114 (-),score=37.02 TRINITY_DN558_c0_g1_i1:906-1247(-)